MVKRKKNKKVGCLTIIAVLIVIGGIGNLLRDNSSDTGMSEVSNTSEMIAENSNEEIVDKSSKAETSKQNSDSNSNPIPILENRTKLQSLFVLLATDWSNKTYSEINEIISKSGLYFEFNQKTMNIAIEKPADYSIWGTEEDYVRIVFNGKKFGRTSDNDKMGYVEYYIEDIPNRIRISPNDGIVLTDFNIPSDTGLVPSTDFNFSNLDEVWSYISTNYPDATFD